MAIVRVALPVPLPQVFDYTAEDAGAEDVGRCVKVPFGRGERTGLIDRRLELLAQDAQEPRLQAQGAVGRPHRRDRSPDSAGMKWADGAQRAVRAREGGQIFPFDDTQRGCNNRLLPYGLSLPTPR